MNTPAEYQEFRKQWAKENCSALSYNLPDGVGRITDEIVKPGALKGRLRQLHGQGVRFVCIELVTP